MTLETKKNLFGVAAGSAATLLVVAAGVLVTASTSGISDAEVVAQDRKVPPVVGTIYDPPVKQEKENEFEKELRNSLDSNHDSTMGALAQQAQVLKRIEELLTKKDEEPQEEQAPAPPKEEDVVKAPEPVRQSPVRMSETTWNLMGTWNYTTDMLRNHLKNDHNIEVDGYTREELQIMHDNIHNGFEPMGSGLKYGGDSKTVRQPATTNSRTRRSGGLLRGLFQRSSSNCPGGT